MEFEKAMRQAARYLYFNDMYIDPKLPEGLWICFKMEDREMIQVNAVCLLEGADYDDIPKCLSFFEYFPYLVIVAPDAEEREWLVKEIYPRLPTCCIYVIPDSSFRGCKTMAEYAENYGSYEIPRILAGAEELPSYGLTDLSTVESRDLLKIPRALSGFSRLDKSIAGFFVGELSVWSGKRGIGKSTLLSQLLVEAMDQGHTVCAYSGELDKAQFREWAYLQAAGPDHIFYRDDPLTGKRLPTVEPMAEQRISEWMKKRFLLFDLERNTKHDPKAILSQFTYAKMRYMADVFLVDNLMAVDFDYQRGFDFNLNQAEFAHELAVFAKRQHVHVHLVVHPRKTYGGQPKKGRADDLELIDSDDVSGSGNIPNRADNVFYLATHLVKDGDKEEVKPILLTLKNRDFGSKVNQFLDFDKKSRRFFADGTGDPRRPYSWDMAAQQMQIRELTGKEGNTPFDKKGA